MRPSPAAPTVIAAALGLLLAGVAVPPAGAEEPPEPQLTFTVDGTEVGTGEAARFERGETLEEVRLEVDGLAHDGLEHVTFVLDGEAPAGSGVGTTAEELGEALLTDDSYDAFDAGIGMANPFVAEGSFVALDGPLTISEDAPVGEWTLRIGLREVDVDADPQRYGEDLPVGTVASFEITEPGVGAPAVSLLLVVALAVAVVIGRLAVGGRRPGAPQDPR